MPQCFSSYIAIENKDGPLEAHLFVCQAVCGAKDRGNCPYGRKNCDKDRTIFQASGMKKTLFEGFEEASEPNELIYLLMRQRFKQAISVGLSFVRLLSTYYQQVSKGLKLFEDASR